MSDITFKYKGVTKGTMDASGTATLNTAGSYSEADYVIEYQKPSIVVESDSEPYSFRANTVDADSYTINKIIGGTVAWNQLIPKTKASGTVATVTVTNNGDGSWTLNGTANAYTRYQFATPSIDSTHKYLITGISGGSLTYGYFVVTYSGSIKSPYIYNDGIYKFNANGNEFSFRTCTGATYSNYVVKPQVFDLTIMFGSTIADYIYALEQSNAGAGVAYFRKLFPKPYYAYNAGELLSVQTSAHRMVGFNQWDEEWELGGLVGATGATYSANDRIRSKNFCRCVPSTVYYCKAPNFYTTIWWYDASKGFIKWESAQDATNQKTVTSPSDAAYFKLVIANNTTTYGNNLCLSFHWDGERDGDYEPYVEYTYALDSDLKLRGILKLDANNNLYYDGDIYPPSGEVQRRYKEETFDGSNDESWTLNTTLEGNAIFQITISDSVSIVNDNNDLRTRCNKLTAYPAYPLTRSGRPTYACGLVSSNRLFVILPSASVADVTALRTWLGTNNLNVVYELATPTTESATPYTNIGRIGKCYAESFIDYRTPSMPVGHNTEYLFLNKQVNTVGYSYIGANPVKILDIAETETALSATGFNTWTPSTTAATIVNSSDVGTLKLDTANYDYVVLWFYDVTILYDGTEENKTKILRQVQCMRSEIYKSPSGLAAFAQQNYNYNRCTGMFTSALVGYYNSSGTNTIAYTQAVGIFPAFVASTFSNGTSDTPTITLKTPNIRAACNASYWSTANAGKVDKANSKFKLRGEVWRVDKLGVLGEMYKNIVDMYNA